MKHRVLKQRNTDPPNPKTLNRDLSQEMDQVAGEETAEMRQGDAEEHEQELMTEAEKISREQMQSTERAEQPHDSPAFWAMMGSMLDAKMNTLGGHFATSLNVVESRLNDKIGSESAVWAEENKAAKPALDNIVQRVEKLERLEHTPPVVAATPTVRRQDGWVQNCIIAGGFHETWSDSQKIAYAESVMRRAQIDKQQHLAPFAPPRSSIVKIRCATAHIAGDMLFRIMRELENSNVEKDDTRKVWAAPERPPEEGHRRRVLRRAVEEVKAMFEPGATAVPVVHWGAGEVMLQDRVLLRAVNGRLCAAEGWGASPPTRGKEWAPRSLTRS